jgi:hypothetical protein
LNFISSFSFISNAAVCALFSGVEIQALFSTFKSFLNKNENENIDIKNEINIENNDVSTNNTLANTVPFIISLIIAAISFLTPAGGPAWPLQNILNICIAITVGNYICTYMYICIFLYVIIVDIDLYMHLHIYMNIFVIHMHIYIYIFTGRAVQLPRLPYIILALAGLVFYDVVSVVGTQQFTGA